MTQYSRIELGKQAKELGFIRDTYEKVCRLSEILSFIENDSYLNTSLALKGGTAINLTIFDLPRLSVDIDLDFTHNISRDQMIKAREIITEKFNIFMKNQGYLLDEKHVKNTHALNSSVYSYTNAGGVYDRIKIEINYLLREHILNPKIRQIRTISGFTNAKILCLDPIEIYGAKITALISRAATRDLYDVNNMFKSELFTCKGLDLLRKCVIFYKTINSDNAFDHLDISAIDKITFSKIRSDLFPVISSSEKKYNLPETVSFVKENLNNILEMSTDEIRFVEHYFNKDLRPELLFDSDGICQRIAKHPIIEWKFSNL